MPGEKPRLFLGALLCCLCLGFFLPGCKAAVNAPRLSGAPVRVDDVTMDTITLSWDPAAGPYPIKYRILDVTPKQYRAVLKKSGKRGGIPAIDDSIVHEKESGKLDGIPLAQTGGYLTFVDGMDINETRAVLKNLWHDSGYSILVLAVGPDYVYSAYPELSVRTLTVEAEAAKKEADKEARIQNLIAEYGRITAGMDSGSRALNDAGYREYERGRYWEAAKLFSASIVFDAANILPHYNLACTLALLREEGQEVDLWEIEHELNICFSLDPAPAGRPADWILSRVREDSDLDAIRDMKFFRAVASYGHSRLYSEVYADQQAWLCGGSWFGGPDIFSFYMDRTFSFTVQSEYGMRGSGSWGLEGQICDDGFYISFDHDEFLAESGRDGSWYAVPGPKHARLKASEMILEVWWKEDENSLKWWEEPGERYQQTASVLWSAVEENAAAKAAGFLRAGYPVNQRYEYSYSGDDSILTPALENKNTAMIRLLAGYGLPVLPKLLPALYDLDPDLWAAVIYRTVKTENASAADLIRKTGANKKSPAPQYYAPEGRGIKPKRE
jgi:hypothetical protein